jgi:hypothetical protein
MGFSVPASPQNALYFCSNTLNRYSPTVLPAFIHLYTSELQNYRLATKSLKTLKMFAGTRTVVRVAAETTQVEAE